MGRGPKLAKCSWKLLNYTKAGGYEGGESPTYVHIRFSNMIKTENWHKLPASPSECVQPVMWTYVHELDVVDAHLKAGVSTVSQFHAFYCGLRNAHKGGKLPTYLCI